MLYFSAYNQQIVEFLRQPNIDEILASKDPSYANSVALKYVIMFQIILNFLR